MYRQYELSSDSDGEHFYMTCWLKSDIALMRGTRLTLKNDPRTWTVEMMSAYAFDAPPWKDWRVGGLQ